MHVVVLSARPELSAQTSRGCGLLSATKGLTHAGTARPLSQPRRLEGFKGWVCWLRKDSGHRTPAPARGWLAWPRPRVLPCGVSGKVPVPKHERGWGKCWSTLMISVPCRSLAPSP